MKINKKVQRLFSVALSIALLITTLPVSMLTVKAATTQFAGGSGTETDPYLIETKEQLNNVRNNLSAHYKMIADIVFTNADFAAGGDFYNNGNGWLPIGNADAPFVGCFDGGGKSISGLTIVAKPSETAYIGLFGYCKNASISNVNIINGKTEITASDDATVNAGLLCGRFQKGYLSNCTVSGNISATTTSVSWTSQRQIVVGGIVGYNGESTIKYCANSATVSTNSHNYTYAGGIVGYNLGGYGSETGKIACCSNHGSITSTTVGGYSSKAAEAGGITSHSYYGVIENSYNTGSISAISSSTDVGGILSVASNTIVTNCYNVGAISASGNTSSSTTLGGIAGYNSFGSISNSYYLDSATKGVGSYHYPQSNQTVKCADADLRNLSTFDDFDFIVVWTIDNCNQEYPYPTLLIHKEVKLPGKEVSCLEAGLTEGIVCTDCSAIIVAQEKIPATGHDWVAATLTAPNTCQNCGETEGEPTTKDWTGYTPISTPEQLSAIRNNLSGNYYLIRDIVFTDEDFEEGGAFYNDGAGWLPIKSSTSSYTFFTGVLDGNGHSIYNLQINAESSTATSVGLFAQNNGTIKNLGMGDGKILLTLSNDVYGYVGAIAGYNEGTIFNCFNTCKVEVNGSTGSGDAGGIAGYNTNGTISNCYNTGIIYSSNDSAGGIAGTNSGTIENCYNTGFIRAELGDDNYCYAGGICGTNHHIVLTCYNIGHISSASSQGSITALLVDIGNPDAKIENCYYLVDDSQAVGIDDDGATKCKKEHMILQNTYSGFDFESIWVISSNSDYLYPELVGNSMNFIKKAQGLTISSLPHKTEYYVGIEDLDITGAKLAKIYNDGTVEEIDVTPSMVTGYDKSKTGSQTITVTYNDTTLEFKVTTLALVYDFTLTTDESISLEYKANKEFDFVLSDESVAKITNVSTSIIDWGTVNVTSSAKVVPLKPGYVIVRVIDKAGYVLSNSLILIEEGNHQLELLETVKKPNCTETGHEIYKCKFCDYQEERFPDALGHTEVLDNRVEPTCTKTGLTGGKHCSVCEEVLVKQNIIEATGIHIWDKGKTDKNGNIHYECDTCEAAYSKNLLSIKVTSKPTKLAYVEHDDMDFSGMVITAYYDNNTTAVISSNWSASYGMNAGTQTVTVEHCGKVDTFTISVKAKVPSAITSSKHTIYGNNISKISAGTTVSSLISSLNEGSFCKVFKGSAEVSGSTVVGTGMVVKIMDGSTVKASYTIIVTGDTNGDGNITVTDMIAIKAHVLKKSTLSGVYATAADTNGDNGISITDFIQVKAKILGKGTITAR